MNKPPTGDTPPPLQEEVRPDNEVVDSSQPMRRPPPPPLRIHHVFLLTVVVSLLAGILRTFPPWTELSQTQEAVWLGYQVTMAIFIATGLTLTGLGIRWRMRGFAYWDQPGQFTALIYGIWVVSYLAAFLEIMLYGETSYQYSWMVSNCLLLITLPLEIYVAWKVCDTTAWRVYFGMGALFSVFQCMGTYDAWWISATFFMTLGWAVLTDVRLGVPRHWSHWCGCGISACNGILRLGLTLLVQTGFFETSA